MMVELTISKLGIVAKDEFDNEVWFYDLNGLHASCATYKGKNYDVDGTQWKQSKRGKISKDFVEWYEEISKIAYEKYYQI